MPDFLTRFSCLLDVGTSANVARAFDIYAALMAENRRQAVMKSAISSGRTVHGDQDPFHSWANRR